MRTRSQSVPSRNQATLNVLKLAATSRILTIFFGVLGTSIVEDYDRSGDLIFPKIQNSVLSAFAKWDSVYFLRIADRGYGHEQVHAFFPGYPFLIRAFDWVLRPFLNRLALSETECLAFSGMLISNVFFCLAALVLFKLTMSVFKDERKAYLSAALFCFPSCTVFMSAVYTESLFSLLSFSVFYLVDTRRNFQALVIIGLAALVRSNATFLLIAFVPNVLKRPIPSISGKGVITLLAAIGLTLGVIHGYLRLSRSTYCDQIEPPSWCHEYSNIYSYAQEMFWDVGILKYWQVKNVAFFFLAVPTFLISVLGVIRPWIRDRIDSVLKRPTWSRLVVDFLHDKMSIYAIHLIACLAVTLLIANVQIVTRLVSSCPAYFWAQSEIVKSGEKLLVVPLTVVHWVYFFIGIVLFCNFLPWT